MQPHLLENGKQMGKQVTAELPKEVVSCPWEKLRTDMYTIPQSQQLVEQLALKWGYMGAKIRKMR